jgi:hypothetical protein
VPRDPEFFVDRDGRNGSREPKDLPPFFAFSFQTGTAFGRSGKR